MMRSYQVRLLVTRKQNRALSELLTELCELYNAALQERRDAWRICQKRISCYDQMRELTELRRIDGACASFPVGIQRDPLRRVDRAFQSFFRRVKTKQTPGYPRFRSRGRYDSFSVGSDNFRIQGDTIVLTKLGGFRFKTRCRIKGQPKAVHVKFGSNGWHASIACDIGPAPEKRAVTKAVGIDLGLHSLATLSDGSEIDNPRWLRQEQDRLADANRSLARKKRGSKNRLKAIERARRLHQHVRGLRRSYLHRISAALVSNFDLIAYEKMNIRGMLAARIRLGRSISDAAWAELIWQLTYKAESAGVWAIPVNPSGTSQACSNCGARVPKRMRQRQHECSVCGVSLGRDHNAALNILRLGESLVESRQNASASGE